MRDLSSWTHADPARSFDLLRSADLAALWADYGGQQGKLYARIIAHADRVGARSVLVEYRYVDADYRSEHSTFYSTTFRRYPSVAHRLHFFDDLLHDTALDTDRPSSFDSSGYLGYTVIRPVDTSPVGRTMIPPEAELSDFVTCSVTDEVNLFGSTLSVTASPFMAQDTQLSVCVHVAAWVCAYYHHLRFKAPRLSPSDISSFAPMERGRMVPSNGLTVTQLAQMLTSARLPPVVYDLAQLPPDETVVSVACRYLDSGMPVVVAAGRHAFVLVGYRWVREEGRRRVQFIRQDDLCGPYELVENIALDQYRPWQHLVTPLPSKVYMSGEGAEKLGRKKLRAILAKGEHPQCAELLADLDSDKPTIDFRSSVHHSNEFKRNLQGNVPDEIAGTFQWLQLSRWIWIVELVYLDKWYKNEDCVVASAIIDATDHAQSHTLLGWRIPGAVGWTVPDFAVDGSLDVPDFGPLRSVVSTNTSVIEI